MAARKKRPSGPSGQHQIRGVLVRAPDDELEAWRQAARRSGTTLTRWVRRAAEEKALRDSAG